MRHLLTTAAPAALALAFLLASGCGDDDRGAVDAGSTPGDGGGAPSDAGTGGADAGGSDAGTGDVDAGSSGDTWDGWAQEFFASYCTECHSGGTRDYTTIEDVMRDADTIRCGASPTALEGCGSWPPPAQFPVGTGPKPSDSERERLVAWIDDGLP